MKAILTLVAAVVFSCSRPQPYFEPSPNYLIEEEDWIVDEGTLPSSYGQDVHVVLSLFPGAPGLDSRYQMTELYPNTMSPKEYGGWIRSVGRYIVLSSPKGEIIHISDRSFIKAVSMKGKLSMPEIGKENLYLKCEGEHELIFLDATFKKLSGDYVLTRRTSPLFTVEGFFSVYNDTTDFFERNTGKQWPVAELAEYDKAVENYDYLSKEKFEGI